MGFSGQIFKAGAAVLFIGDGGVLGKNTFLGENTFLGGQTYSGAVGVSGAWKRDNRGTIGKKTLQSAGADPAGTPVSFVQRREGVPKPLTKENETTSTASPDTKFDGRKGAKCLTWFFGWLGLLVISVLLLKPWSLYEKLTDGDDGDCDTTWYAIGALILILVFAVIMVFRPPGMPPQLAWFMFAITFVLLVLIVAMVLAIECHTLGKLATSFFVIFLIVCTLIGSIASLSPDQLEQKTTKSDGVATLIPAQKMMMLWLAVFVVLLVPAAFGLHSLRPTSEELPH